MLLLKGSPPCPGSQEQRIPECIEHTLLPHGLLHLWVPCYHDNLHHQVVATLSNHVDHLPVTDLYHILSVDLEKRSEGKVVPQGDWDRASIFKFDASAPKGLLVLVSLSWSY